MVDVSIHQIWVKSWFLTHISVFAFLSVFSFPPLKAQLNILGEIAPFQQPVLAWFSILPSLKIEM